MKILVADKLSDQVVASLKKLGAEVRVEADIKADDLPKAIGDADVLIVRSKKVTDKTIQSATHLALIIRAGAGVNTIDVKAANVHGIYVTNCPGKNSDAVAELAIGLLIAADRRIVDATLAMREGKWRKKEFGKSRGLKGRTLGILGLGMIGEAVAKRALGLEMNVMAWSRSLTPERAEALGLGFASSPMEVAQKADAISLHLAVKAETKHIVNEAFLEAMKPGAILINAARGDVVDTAALKKAMASKKLRVGADVFEGEPEGGEAEFADTELAKLITCTPHIGASTNQAEEAIADETVRIVKVYKDTGVPPNAVNLCTRSPAQYQLVVRHYDKVGVLANVLTELRKEGINVEEMRNVVFEGAHSACCTLLLDAEPPAVALQAIRRTEHVIQISVTSRNN